MYRVEGRPTNPQEALRAVLEAPHFDDRLLGEFFLEKVVPNYTATTDQSVTVIEGDIKDSFLRLKLTNGRTAGLNITTGAATRRRNLAEIYRYNMIGIHEMGGGLENQHIIALNHPNAAETYLLLADLADKNARERSVDAILAGYPRYQEDFRLKAYSELLREYTNPLSLRVADMPDRKVEYIAGRMLDEDETKIFVSVEPNRRTPALVGTFDFASTEGDWRRTRVTVGYDPTEKCFRQTLGGDAKLSSYGTRLTAEMLDFLNSVK